MDNPAKDILGNWTTAVLGVGVIGAILYGRMYGKERRREREAFRKLDLAELTPKDIWEQALDFGRKRRVELAAENAEYQELVEHAAGLIEISEGLRKCAIMLSDRSVPDEVKAPIYEHWCNKWWEFMGFDIVLMKSLFERLDADLVSKFRQKFEEYDKRVEAREAREQSRKYTEADLSCSFCGKSAKEVEKLIAGPSVYICSECVELCEAIMAEERIKKAEKRVQEVAEQLEAAEEEDDDPDQ